MLNLKYVTQDSGRPFIVKAVNAAVARYSERNYSPMGHCVPPRCGKSSIIALTAAELSAIGCPMTFVFAPWVFLTEQLTDPQKLYGSFTYYAPETEMDFSADIVENVRSHLFFKRTDKSIKMLVLTNGLVNSNIKQFCDAVRTIVETHGVPPTVIIDEVHLVSEKNPQGWGLMIQKIIDAGAFVIGVTGTPVTTDKRDIPGFASVKHSSEDAQRSHVHLSKLRVDEEGNRFAPKTLLKGKNTKYSVEAIDGVNLPWKEAFKEDWLVKMDFELVDIEVTLNGERKKIKDVPLKDYAGNHADWVRDPAVMKPLLVEGLQHLDAMTRHAIKFGCTTRPRMLVVTSPDREGDKRGNGHKSKSNFQARAARDIILEMLENDVSLTFGGHRPVVAIATSMSDDGEPDHESSQKIKDFAAGRVDILIVKAMGLVGLDVPECKVLSNISQYREGALMLQLGTRICTPWGSKAENATRGERWAASVRGCYIGLNDKKNDEFKKTIEGMGGTDNKQTRFEAESAQDDGEIPLSEIKGPVDSEIHGVSGANLSTESNEEINVSTEEMAILHVVRRKYPDAIALSNVAIMRMHRVGAFPVDKVEVEEVIKTRPKVNIKNPAQEREALKGKFGKRAQAIVNSYIPYSKENGKRYGSAISILQTMAKIKCGVFADVPSIDDVEILKRLIEALEDSVGEFARCVGRGEI